MMRRSALFSPPVHTYLLVMVIDLAPCPVIMYGSLVLAGSDAGNADNYQEFSDLFRWGYDQMTQFKKPLCVAEFSSTEAKGADAKATWFSNAIWAITGQFERVTQANFFLWDETSIRNFNLHAKSEGSTIAAEIAKAGHA